MENVCCKRDMVNLLKDIRWQEEYEAFMVYSLWFPVAINQVQQTFLPLRLNLNNNKPATRNNKLHYA
jgi:hypothetical protein